MKSRSEHVAPLVSRDLTEASRFYTNNESRGNRQFSKINKTFTLNRDTPPRLRFPNQCPLRRSCAPHRSLKWGLATNDPCDWSIGPFPSSCLNRSLPTES